MPRTLLRQAAALLALFTPLLSAQKPAFEAASIKPNASASDGGSMGMRGQRFVATNVSLSALLAFAFTPQGRRLRQEQVIGLPSWGNADRFDVEAVSQSGDIPIAQARLMLQSLLEERFSLKFHPETRDLPVYDLVLNKRGPKLSEDQTPPDPRGASISFSSSPSSAQPDTPLARGASRFSTAPGVTTITASAITTSTLIDLLQGQTDRMILDRTDLKGRFDIKIEFAPARAQAAESGAASVFTAIQESGFRLDSVKEPTEVIVIGSVQKPSAN